MSENVLDEQLSRGEHRAQPELLMPHTVLARTAADLAAKYEGVVSRQTVERCVFESYTALRRTSRVHAHLTTLAGRFAADRLRALAQADGSAPKDVPESPVHLRAERRPLADGRRIDDPPRHRSGTRALRRVSPRALDQPDRRRSNDLSLIHI